MHGRDLSAKSLFLMMANENSVARSVYTKDIVELGKKIGLSFGEDWRDPSSKSGPLPALFLRNCADLLFQSRHPLGLRLASDRPINKDNKLSAAEMKIFERVVSTEQPQFDVIESTGMRLAMFPDVAVSRACVDCHNEHEDSPESNWQVGDMMGVTLWTWPLERVSTRESLTLLSTFRNAVKATYSEYVGLIEKHDGMPRIGEGWPRESFSLPSPDQFLDRVVSRASKKTLSILVGDPASK